METLLLIAGILELVGGFLILVGFLTRPVAFVLSGMMAVAYWGFHAPMNPFPSNNLGAAAILLCFVFFYLVFAGRLKQLKQKEAGPDIELKRKPATAPGAWSVDNARRARITAGAEEGTLPWPS
jgi:DoxX